MIPGRTAFSTAAHRVGLTLIGARSVSTNPDQNRVDVAEPYNHGILFGAGQDHGFVYLRDVEFLRVGSGKWGGRFHGRLAGLVARGVIGRNLQEWVIYDDNPQGTVQILDCLAEGCWRGLYQGTNRKESGPPNQGDTIIGRNTLRDCGASGAGGITVAGRSNGTVYVFGNDISFPSSHKNHVGITVWNEGPDPSKGKLGAHKTPSGHATREVVIGPRNKIAGPNKIHLGSVQHVTISPCEFLTAGKPDIRIANPKLSGHQPAPESITMSGRDKPSDWKGWSGAAPIELSGKPLTMSAIDQYAAVPAVPTPAREMETRALATATAEAEVRP